MSVLLDVEPIIPTLAQPFHGRLGLREKYDGWRMLAFKDGSRVRLVSRNGRDHTHCFSDIAAAVAKLPASTLILDGEVVRFDDQLISRFFLLSDAPEDALVTPPLFMAFDCVYAGGRDLRAQPLAARREVLKSHVDGTGLVFVARRLAPDGLVAWDNVQRRGLEGLVAKDDGVHLLERRPVSYLAQGQSPWHEGRFLVGGSLTLMASSLAF